MKTPREILLERHRSAAPKLDKLRHETVNAVFNRRSLFATILDWPTLLWRELIWPCRRVWMGLATVWILILAVNISMRDNSRAEALRFPSMEMMATSPSQQKLLDELLSDRSEPMAAEQPKIYSPQPRTEIRRFIST